MAVAAVSAFAEPQLYMAGDSIMADYRPDMFPQYGWGGQCGFAESTASQ